MELGSITDSPVRQIIRGCIDHLHGLSNSSENSPSLNRSLLPQNITPNEIGQPFLMTFSLFSSLPSSSSSVSSEMGLRDQATIRSDSGYGDDASEVPQDGPDAHPLTLKGYDIGPASKLQVGDVFEFLWADAPEFEWEWKCLGYTRFIVLRHSDTFPHHCACIPISVGGKHEFAKPGIDHFQQGYVFANGDPAPESPRLPYSAVGIELRPGKLRIKEDSRANYADIVDVDHDAQVMVVGDVVRYFDRVRRNVNKAFMRQILRRALEEYKTIKASEMAAEGNKISKMPQSATTDGEDTQMSASESIQTEAASVIGERRHEREEKRHHRRHSGSSSASRRKRNHSQASVRPQRESVQESRPEGRGDFDYDARSMHNVAMAGLK
ncbi:uncharacterized protein F4822DRAFT_399386 [Hypoxylon trugodes]|uniref:uncharacterized protein n=1 Tax=Hypoxylon trugodes TaxID=326681 RepID=UPI0021A1D70C|nr:uncharacterized protein F4822DRAFT_399386 [Hypoxylon trugodes]KAI1389700.1 hypothetical protein F4822DRAFT_399386 [Hypoxylon trugodes]